MAFERYTDSAKRMNVAGSISEGGVISLTQGARHKFRVEEGHHAVLYYDKETNRIGIGLTNDAAEPGARKVMVSNYGASIRAKPFLAYFEIDVPRTVRMPVWLDDESNLIIFDLNIAVERGSKAHKEGDNKM